MAAFEYKALEKTGKQKKGVMEGAITWCHVPVIADKKGARSGFRPAGASSERGTVMGARGSVPRRLYYIWDRIGPY